ncbi:DUF3037 domain-containing protein [Photobacterium phosphoreum]|uniref:DUF3037 domain-containing protein n=1 Tax=Photobacterium phosphoreum TaxID=659 RepID=UPI000D16758C|nr:DUF3037 domain-containing protein [Photobacterium phosphoreum]PSU79672.1 DUF3037 domain-containing protein [Photobacterium phosphoreum]PSW33397.1 DUF3037 domain-containing protein [Photobacterium phosphoreum]
MKVALQFAIVRFMPFAETSEFANVGILAFAPKTGFVSYKLAPARFKRVSDFFDDLEGQLYKQAIANFEDELNYIQNFSKNISGKELVELMHEVTRTREGLMTFGETGAMITDDCHLALEQLFGRYIGRDFKDTKEYREQQMVKALRQELKTLTIRYKEQSLDTGFSQFKIPLVAKEANITKAIKPLAFDQATPLALVDHGDRWISRVKHLLQANALNEDNFLFTIERPRNKKEEFVAAFDTVEKGMKELGVKVIPYQNSNEILKFAEFDLDDLVDDFELVTN